MNDNKIKNIGFIGLGVMGSSMSKNLLKNKNWKVFVKDLDYEKEKELESYGASIALDLKDIFNKSDVIITCLPGGDFVKDLYFGKSNLIALRPMPIFAPNSNKLSGIPSWLNAFEKKL